MSKGPSGHVSETPSRRTILSSKKNLLELTCDCEEVAYNIEDHLTGG
jgi:hypothetical protein